MKPTAIAFLTSSIATAGMVTGAFAVGTGLEFVLEKIKEDN